MKKWFYLYLLWATVASLFASSIEVMQTRGGGANRSLLTQVSRDSDRLLQLNYSVIEPRSFQGENVPTVLWLGGGPGENLENLVQYREALFPEHARVIVVEYRGMGVNRPLDLYQGELQSNFFKDFSTDTIVADILSILKREAPKNYFIFGQSFGTVVATKLSAAIDRVGMQAPEAVILEGTYSRPSSQEEIDEVAKVLNHSLKELHIKLGDLFTAPKSYGYTLEDWSRLYRYALLANGLNGAKEFIIHMVSQLTGEQHNLVQAQAYMDSLLKDASVALGYKYRDGLEETMSPQEIYRLAQTEVETKILLSEIRYTNSEFVLENGRFAGKRTVVSIDDIINYLPYNSDDWQINAPIYYIHGRGDIATLHSSGVNHFKGQKKSPLKKFISVDGDGHSPLFSLETERAKLFWQGIFRGDLDVESIFPTGVVLHSTVTCDRSLKMFLVD